MLDLSPNGRIALGSLALLVAGFAMGCITRLAVTNEEALALLGVAGTLLFVASRGRDRDERRHAHRRRPGDQSHHDEAPP